MLRSGVPPGVSHLTGGSGFPRVDWRAATSLVGTVLRYLSVALLVPLVVGLWYGADAGVFAISFALTVLLGSALERLHPDPELGAREAFLFVALTWLVIPVVGAVPYILAGMGTASTLAHPVNALFEAMSGFTTTGATVMGEIGFERHSRALLLWRQLTQWLGGMGIVVLAIAILPELSVGGAELMAAEAPGPGFEKLTPRIAETARALWLVYVGVTLLEVLVLYGLHLAGWAPAMTPYDALVHPLTTMPTGGFSPQARSIAAFSAAVQWVIIPFMVVAGTNFALLWRLTGGNPGALVRDEEFRFYAGVLASLTAVTAALVFAGPGVSGPAGRALRHGAFQTVSIVTTTGYASADFAQWGPAAQFVLLGAMFVGGSAGSTGGAIKMVRWLVVLKSVRRELFMAVHPDAVRPIRLGGRALDEETIGGIHAFTLLYLLTFVLGVAVVSTDAARVGLALTVPEAISAVAATIGNVGPGLGIVGPMNSYLSFSPVSKLAMVFLMWIGRLEIIPVLVLLTRPYWRS